MVCLVLLTSSMSVKSTASCFPALTSQVKPIPFLLRIQFASCVSLWYFLLFLPIRTQDFCFWVSIFWGCGLDTWHSWDSGAAQPHLSYWVNVTYTILQSGSSWQAFQQLHHISTTCEALEKGQNPPQIRSDSCLQLTLRFASSEVLSRGGLDRRGLHRLWNCPFHWLVHLRHCGALGEVCFSHVFEVLGNMKSRSLSMPGPPWAHVSKWPYIPICIYIYGLYIHIYIYQHVQRGA